MDERTVDPFVLPSGHESSYKHREDFGLTSRVDHLCLDFCPNSGTTVERNDNDDDDATVR